MKFFVCRGCVNTITITGCTSVNIGVKANLELVDKFCYLADMVIVDGDAGVHTYIHKSFIKMMIERTNLQ